MAEPTIQGLELLVCFGVDSGPTASGRKNWESDHSGDRHTLTTTCIIPGVQ